MTEHSGSAHGRDGRRDFLKATVAVAAAGAAGTALAQGNAPQEGIDYRLVKPPQPTDTPNKIEVIEFFWYGCPHCNAFEPSIREWSSKLPAEVAFHKLHVNFQEVRHQQLFYTLEAMGKAAEMNDWIFKAIHVERNRLDTPEKMADFLAKQGIDRKQFLDTFDSFTVKTKMRKATALQDAYKVDGVPALGVNGKYYTAPSMAGSNQAALQVVDYLVGLERKAKGAA